MSETGGARALKAYLRHMKKIEAKVRFMSIEPLWFDVAPVFEEWLESGEDLPFEWAIIGAAPMAVGYFSRKKSGLHGCCNCWMSRNVPIFFKGNMEWETGAMRFHMLTKSFL